MTRYYFTRTDPISARALESELRDATLDVEGVADLVSLSEQVAVDFITTPTSGELTTTQGIVTAHTGTDPWMDVYQHAETNAQSIPGWAHWTEAEAETWFDTNVGTPLTNARDDIDGLGALNLTIFKLVMTGLLDIMDSMATMLWAMARMIVALRDRTWPHLSN